MDSKSQLLANNTIEKLKFRHSDQKLMFCDTFIRNGEIHYAVQSYSKQFFVGVADSKFTICSTGQVGDRINCWLYLGSTKGHIYCWNLAIEQQKQCHRIESIHGKSFAGLVVFRQTNDEQDKIVAFSSDGNCLYFENKKLVVQKKWPYQISKVSIAKMPQNQEDIWIVLTFKNGPHPYVLDLVWIKKYLMSAQKDSLETGVKQYENCMKYEEDELQKMPKQPVAISISNSAAIIAMACKNSILIYTVDKKQNGVFYLECDFHFQDEEIIQIDLTDANLAFISQKSIICFNLERRKKIAKKMSIKGSQGYGFVRWANFGKQIIFGSYKANNMKLLHTTLNLI